MSETIREPLKNENVYRGMLIEARDGVNWYMAKVLEHNKELEKVLIHFQGWNSKYDEWLPLNSTRIRHVLGKEVNVISPKVLSIGDNIITRWSSKFDYTPGKILRLNPNDKEGYVEVGFVDCTKKIVRTTAIKPLDAKFDLKGYIESLSEYLPTSIFNSLQSKEELNTEDVPEGIENRSEDAESNATPSQLPFTDLAMIQELYALSLKQTQTDSPKHMSNAKGLRKKRYAPLYHHTISPDKTDTSLSHPNNEPENLDGSSSSKRTPRVRTKSKRLSSPIPLSTFQNFKAKRADAKRKGKGYNIDDVLCDEISNPIYTTGRREVTTLTPYDKAAPLPPYYVPGIDVLDHNYLIGRPRQMNLIPFGSKASRSDVKPFVCRGGTSDFTADRNTREAQDSPPRRGKKRKTGHLFDLATPNGSLTESHDSSIKTMTQPAPPKFSTTFNDEIAKYHCRQKGCRKDFRNVKLLQSHLTHFHGLDPSEALKSAKHDASSPLTSPRTKGAKLGDNTNTNLDHQPEFPPGSKRANGSLEDEEFVEERISYLSTSSSSYGEQEDAETKARRKQRLKRRKPKEPDFVVPSPGENRTGVEGAGDEDDNSSEDQSNDKNPPALTGAHDSDYDVTLDLKRSVKRRNRRPAVNTTTTPDGTELHADSARACNSSGSKRGGLLTISTKSFFTRRTKPTKTVHSINKTDSAQMDEELETAATALNVQGSCPDLAAKQSSGDGITFESRDGPKVELASHAKNDDELSPNATIQSSSAGALPEQNDEPAAITRDHCAGQQKKKSFNLIKKRALKPVWAGASGSGPSKQTVASPKGMLAETEEGIIHCPCGYNQENGLMIQCDLCLCWLHAQCVGFGSEDTVPERFICNFCTDPRNASPKRLARALNGEWTNDGGRLASLEPGLKVGLTTNDQAIFRSSLVLRRRVVEVGTCLRSLGSRINTCITGLDLEKFNDPSLNDLIAHLEYEEKVEIGGVKKEEIPSNAPNLIKSLTSIEPSVLDAGFESKNEAEATIQANPMDSSANGVIKSGEEENFNLFLLQEAATSTQAIGDVPIPVARSGEQNLEPKRERSSDAQGDVGQELLPKTDSPNPNTATSETVPGDGNNETADSMPAISTNPDQRSGSPLNVDSANVLDRLVAEQNVLEKHLDTLEKELQDLEKNPYFMFDNPTDKTLASEYASRDFEGPTSYSYADYAHYSNPYINDASTSSSSQPLLKRDLYVTRTQLDKVLTQLNSFVEGDESSNTRHQGTVKETDSKKGGKAALNNTAPTQNMRNNEQPFQTIIKATAT